MLSKDNHRIYTCGNASWWSVNNGYTVPAAQPQFCKASARTREALREVLTCPCAPLLPSLQNLEQLIHLFGAPNFLGKILVPSCDLAMAPALPEPKPKFQTPKPTTSQLSKKFVSIACSYLRFPMLTSPGLQIPTATPSRLHKPKSHPLAEILSLGANTRS